VTGLSRVEGGEGRGGGGLFRDARYFAPISRDHHAAEDNFCSHDNRFGESHDIASESSQMGWDVPILNFSRLKVNSGGHRIIFG